MIQLRYPSITGRTPEEKLAQMERFFRSMIDQLNMFLKKAGETENEDESANYEKLLNSKLSKYEKDMMSLFGKMHPVGSIYLSVSSTSPATLFGGKWEQIKDTFLLASGSTYSAGATGGEATHTLTVNEMPRHNHRPDNYNQAGSERGYERQFTTNLHTNSDSTGRAQVQVGASSGEYAMVASTASDITGADYTTNTGGSAAHNNMPPYLAVYVWKRIE